MAYRATLLSLPHPYYGPLSGTSKFLPSSRSLNPLPPGELRCLKSRDLRDRLQYPNQSHFNGHSSGARHSVFFDSLSNEYHELEEL